MKKVNLSLLSIFVLFLFPLLTISATSAWAATYYVDAVYGNDATGVPDNINLPFKTIAKINAFFRAGTIVHGDYIKFRRGTTPTEQTWRGEYIDLGACSGTSGAPITFATYGNGSYKPSIKPNKVYPLSPDTWQASGTTGVWYCQYSVISWAYEDDVPLRPASDATCSDGNWYPDSTTNPKRLYYKPTDGLNPTTHMVTWRYADTAFMAGWTNNTPNNYITVDGIIFSGAGIEVFAVPATNTPTHHWTIQNCDFWYRWVAFDNSVHYNNYVSDMTVQNCSFHYCESTSIHMETIGLGNSFLRMNILNNTIVNNGRMPDGLDWATGGRDNDCIAIQNMKDSNIIGNDISGLVAGPTANNAITFFMDQR